MKAWRTVLLAAVMMGLATVVVSAGATLDYGTVPGTPAVGTVTWIAWHGDTFPPLQLITEDSVSPGLGTNRGYQLVSGTPSWRMQVRQFDPDPASGATVTILLTSVGGSNWRDNFSWVNTAPPTNQGEALAITADARPRMLLGSQDDTGKTIHWSGTAASYLIYRSQNGSGTTPDDNGASNGRYDYVATVNGTTYHDTLCGTGKKCWHIVVPASGGTAINAGEAISGGHSEESNPTAVTMSTFRAADPAVNWPLIVGAGVLALAVLGGLAVTRRRAVRR